MSKPRKEQLTAAVTGGPTPSSLSTTASSGTSSFASPADHVHTHGVLSDASLHATASSTHHGFLSSADKNKLIDIHVNVVTDFGADPTGAADSITAITNAIAAVSAGGTVFFPTGTYKTSAPIIINAAFVTLKGAGRRATIIRPTGSFAAITFSSSPHPVYNSTIEDIEIQFISITNVSSGTIGVDASNSSSGRFNNVVVTSVGNSGLIGFLLMEDATGNSPYYNHFYGCDVGGGGTGTNSYGYKMPLSGGPTFGANANQVIGGHIVSCDYAVFCESGQINVFDGIVTETIYVDHYYFGTSASYNEVRTGYYEGINGSYVVKFATGSPGAFFNVVKAPDTGLGVIDPSGQRPDLGQGTNSVITDGITHKTGNAITLNASVLSFTAEVGAASLSASTILTLGTPNYNLQLIDASSEILSVYSLFSFSDLIAPTIRQRTRASDLATFDLTIKSQTPYASATGSHRNPGNLILDVPAPTSGGTAGKISLQISDIEVAQVNSSGFLTSVLFLTSGTVSASGLIRAPNNQTILTARNATDSADINLLLTNNSNTITIGDATNSPSISFLATTSMSFSAASQYTFGTSNYSFFIKDSGGVISQHPTFKFDEFFGGVFGTVQRTSDAATFDMQIVGQAPFASATGSNRNSGGIIISTQAPVAGGTAGAITLNINALQKFKADSTGISFYGGSTVAQASRVGQLTDSTTGTPGGTISDVGASFDQTTLNNNFASVIAKLNALELVIHNISLTT